MIETSFRPTQRSIRATRADAVEWQGLVVGINTAIAGIGLGLAVPINDATRTIIVELMRDGRVRRAWLGVAGGSQPLAPRLARQVGHRSGISVAEVVPNSPASRSGLQPGDVILEVDNHPVGDAGGLQRLMIADAIGRQMVLHILRGRNRARAARNLRDGWRPDRHRPDRATKKPPAFLRAVSFEPVASYRRRTEFARGPLGLCSISNSTFSPPSRRSKSRRAGVERVAVEEVFLLVLRCDEAEAAIGDDLLDGSGGHSDPPTSSRTTDQTHDLFEKRSITRRRRTARRGTTIPRLTAIWS